MAGNWINRESGQSGWSWSYFKLTQLKLSYTDFQFRFFGQVQKPSTTRAGWLASNSN